MGTIAGRYCAGQSIAGSFYAKTGAMACAFSRAGQGAAAASDVAENPGLPELWWPDAATAGKNHAVLGLRELSGL
ncbi:hypothetical protein Xedl_03957 [Xenorhabdus eapokensis]|uniref:Uncharacterized protein n=1 Tax=Xenorhabdus eapokensis TaxID=1873482 RepID=A0A1Q5T3W7_9GAMM|nr:hypothetical protein Xedl_03957 [Xenorhabdus eapokensis]